MADSKSAFNFILLGKSGVGKSTTGNTLIGRKNVFKASSQAISCTLECGAFENNTIKVVNTPGLMDTKESLEITVKQIENGIGMLGSDGFDALLLVMKFGDRCTKELLDVFSALKATLGDVFLTQYCIIVITHGENFDSEYDDVDARPTIDSYYREIKEPPELVSLLMECEYKVVFFYNKTPEKRQESMLKLLDFIKNRKIRYNKDIFEMCAKKRNEFLNKLKLPEMTAEIKEKLSPLKAELEKAIEYLNKENESEIKEKAQQLLNKLKEMSKRTDLKDV